MLILLNLQVYVDFIELSPGFEILCILNIDCGEVSNVLQ